MEKKEKILFDLVASMGETLDGTMHIIDMSDEHPVAEEQKFRVYHIDGFCFDVVKEVETEDDNGNVTYYYDMYAEWDGFANLTIDSALKLVTDNLE